MNVSGQKPQGALFTAFLLGSTLNFLWEMAHSLLYRGSTEWTWGKHLLCCGLASIADGVGIAAIFGIGAFAFRDPRWTERPSSARLGTAILLGLTGALITEQLALRLGWWTYEPRMPRIPGTDLAVSPVLQFIVVPLVVLFWALPRRWMLEAKHSRRREMPHTKDETK